MYASPTAPNQHGTCVHTYVNSCLLMAVPNVGERPSTIYYETSGDLCGDCDGFRSCVEGQRKQQGARPLAVTAYLHLVNQLRNCHCFAYLTLVAFTGFPHFKTCREWKLSFWKMTAVWFMYMTNKKDVILWRDLFIANAQSSRFPLSTV